MKEGFLTIGHCFLCCFLEIFVADKAVMHDGGGQSCDRGSLHQAKPCVREDSQIDFSREKSFGHLGGRGFALRCFSDP